jgi:hypothetical protein
MTVRTTLVITAESSLNQRARIDKYGGWQTVTRAVEYQCNASDNGKAKIEDADGLGCYPKTGKTTFGKGVVLDASDASDTSKDKDGDGYTNIEEYLNGTDPTVFVDYTKAKNKVNTLK